MRARRARHERAGKLAEVQAELARGQSQQALARPLQVPRATLRGWLAQEPSGDVPAALAQFYASAEGVVWLHRQVLAAQMPQRRISVCEEETYHPESCLVAVEPVSNLILRECYAQDRSAAIWTQALADALEGLRARTCRRLSPQRPGDRTSPTTPARPRAHRQG